MQGTAINTSHSTKNTINPPNDSNSGEEKISYSKHLQKTWNNNPSANKIKIVNANKKLEDDVINNEIKRLINIKKDGHKRKKNIQKKYIKKTRGRINQKIQNNEISISNQIDSLIDIIIDIKIEKLRQLLNSSKK